MFAAHHHQGALQVSGDALLIGLPLHEAGLQPSNVRQNIKTHVFIVAELSRQLVRLETEKLGQQWPTVFQIVDQNVVNIDERGTPTGFKLIGRTPGCLAVLAI